ncbi:hypothetical protein I6A84_25945 [Frankia sp. CNm7]|uniref:Uncharacterized protein n=1 Tax=Frankia nepalensis TaxID=1836974 RepID=A0A937RNB6_9ACTN|nr:hypothetical protein [Frankia nepalensis]MBL7495271.1 hypothetical protein [Frankia nepalensis]MBL7515849.1 hypothetical protein [Frankia nepalensis]MBL7521431.1 hypothetical protein [Frankia nepalensis]MBL7629006.1 hypothetical protein [Frankia nepalensis]
MSDDPAVGFLRADVARFCVGLDDLFDGCQTGLDTVTAVRDAGFTVNDLHRFRFPDTGPPSPAAPHVRGTATRRTDR